jgi:hypothetical protein
MEPLRLVQELRRTAEKLGLPVRERPFHVPPNRGGGLCRVRGRPVVLLDEKATLMDRALALAEALATYDLEGIYLAPEARRLVEAARRGRSPGAPPRPKPGLRSTHS